MIIHLLRCIAPLAIVALWAFPSLAQPAPEPLPTDWHHLDLERDGFAGMSTYRAYEELLEGRTPQRSVIVAVIDSGVDTSHTGLAGRMWRAPAASGASSHTGYPGAVYGWSFLGNPAGENVEHDTYEYAREYARLRTRFEPVDPAELNEEDRIEYVYFTTMRDSLYAKRAEMKEYRDMVLIADEAYHTARAILGQYLNDPDYSMDQVEKIQTSNGAVLQAREIAFYLDANDLDEKSLAKHLDYVEGMLQYSLNADFDPRHIVGDNYEDVTERYYGSPDVHGPDPSHGTGVASLIAARHDSEFGVRGVARDSVFIMAVRAVPQGDERDKDVANAIRFAVDHGAHVINMSFGKPVSPQKDAVDEAVRYAMERGVLMIHAAGNDSRDLSVTPSYPSRFLNGGETAELWMTIGASAAFTEMLAASFSNYSAEMVDVFAPGEDVFALAPDNGTDTASGTSFAAPQVAGLAALLMSYYPQLSARDVRRIIMESATPLANIEVMRPGSMEQVVPFGALSNTGGVINVYQAIRLAEQTTSAP